jgi:formylmethanofuran dehydrogenase subunit D
MARLQVTLITGRSAKQGIGISHGKTHPEYQEAINFIELSSADMGRAGFADGERVILKTDYGAVKVQCRRSDIPEGLAFMAFGSICNQLVGEETHASGMPDSKHVQVEISNAS